MPPKSHNRCHQFPNIRVIIDATEIKVEIPSSLVLHSQTYSNYKSTNTLKGLVGISPSGHITFVSQLYTGSISDRELTERSGFLNLPFDHNDTIMADKGFDIQDILDNYGLKLDIPPFLHKQEQMSAVDVATTQQIANKRIHVERAISKIKSKIPYFRQSYTFNFGWNCKSVMDSMCFAHFVSKPNNFLI